MSAEVLRVGVVAHEALQFQTWPDLALRRFKDDQGVHEEPTTKRSDGELVPYDFGQQHCEVEPVPAWDEIRGCPKGGWKAMPHSIRAAPTLVPIVRGQKKDRRLVWHAWESWLSVITFTVFLSDIVVQHTFHKAQGPLPNSWKRVARGDFFVGDAVDCGCCSGLRCAQDLIGHLNDLREARSWLPWVVDGLGGSNFDNTTATYVRSRCLQVQ